MEKSEEKLLEFFNNENKVKQLMQDDEFAERVSGGLATEKTYIDEFKKFGLDITKSEARGISKAANEFLSVQKLDDETVSEIIGGVKTINKPGLVGGITGLTFAAISGGALIAQMVSAHNAAEARLHGNRELANYYDEQHSNLLKSSLIFGLTAPVAGLGAGWGTSIIEDSLDN